MNSAQFDIVKALIEEKKYDVITEYSHITHPEKGEIIVNEYAGNGVRVYKDNKGNTRVLCPKNIDVVQEGHVAQAIANGSIFDDADEVDRNATMIERTSIPYDAMINSGKDTPKQLKPMIAIVIGRMDDNGSFEVSDADRTNGTNFVKDLCDKEKCPDATKVVDNYLEKDSQDFYSPEMGKNLTDLDNEVDDIVDTKPEDVVTDDDTVDSYDDYDMDEIESDEEPEDEPDDELTEEFLSTLYDDMEIYQEGVFSMIKTLKRVGYDRKTKTILTDIPVPGATKKDEKVRVNVKLGDAISLANGTCVTWSNDKEGNVDKSSIVMHISAKDLLFSSKEELLESIKHEEGHMAIRYDPEKFKKDFIRAGAAVKRYKDELKANPHGSSREEYVADLYSANHSDSKGAGLSKFFDKQRKKYIKQTNSVKKLFERLIRIAEKNRQKIYHNKNISPEERDRLLSTIREQREDLDKAFKEDIIPALDELFKNISAAYKQDQSYAEDADDVKDMFRKKKTKILNSRKEMYVILSENLSEAKFVSYIDYLKSVPKEMEELQKALVHEMGLRKAFIKRYANKNDGKVTKESFSIEECGDAEVVEEDGVPIETIKRSIYNKTPVPDNSKESEFQEQTTPPTEGTSQTGATNSIPMPASAQAKTVATNKEQVKNSTVTQEDGDQGCKSSALQPPAVQTEGFLSKRPKKLKPIGRDVVAYITVEMNDIHSANDQAMLAGYTCSKIELVDFYLTVLDTQDARYIVPHNKQYLIQMKNDLERLLAQILRIRPINRSEQIWRVNYPTQ